MANQADQSNLPVGLDIEAEISFRQARLVNLTQAKTVLEERAQARYETEQAEYEAKVRQREQKAQERVGTITQVSNNNLKFETCQALYLALLKLRVILRPLGCETATSGTPIACQIRGYLCR